jgi:hypothetical protein
VWGVFSKTGKRVKTGEGKNNYNQLAIQYANQPEKLGNYIYGGKNGNQVNEGYKYRGRGYNGITFKNLYAVLSNKYGVDFINNPDAINQPKNSANSLIYYFTDLNNHFKPNDVTSLNDSITKTFRHNAGWGYGNPSESNEGYKKMLMYGPEFKKYVDAFIKKKSNPDYEIAPIYVQSGNKYPQLINILFLLGILGIGIYFVNKKRKLTS